jgi:hypothetical protein
MSVSVADEAVIVVLSADTIHVWYPAHPARSGLWRWSVLHHPTARVPTRQADAVHSINWCLGITWGVSHPHSRKAMCHPTHPAKEGSTMGLPNPWIPWLTTFPDGRTSGAGNHKHGSGTVERTGFPLELFLSLQRQY